MILVFVLCSCASEQHSRRWGQHATINPGWDRVYRSAISAASAPEVWVPAAGAILFQVDDWDEEVSEWAAEQTPVFGSQENADMWSDHFMLASQVAYVTTAIAAPGADTFGEWTSEKLKGFTVGAGAYLVNDGMAWLLKNTTQRQRPDGSDTRSFPSGHATRTSLFSSLTSKNIDYFNVPAPAKTSARVILGAFSLGAAWARVEARKHYPSDVLAGITIGNFIGTFFNEAFLDPAGESNISILLVPSNHGLLVGTQVLF